jgi:hypothetical protein
MTKAWRCWGKSVVKQIEKSDYMIMKKVDLFCAAVVMLFGLACPAAKAQLPPDFPQLSILPNTNPAPGYLFGSLSVCNVPGVSNYFAILDNAGNPILLNKTNSLGTLACNGLFVTSEGKEGQPVRFLSKDSSFNVVATNVAGNGYVADTRDFEVLPNGHALTMIYDSQYLDLSAIFPGGYPATRVDQAVIQEVDVDNNVVFQWRSLDHIPVTYTYEPIGKELDYIHVNSIWFDELDGNIIASCRGTSEVIKISRVSGDILWRMRGKHNQFTFTNSIPSNADPAFFQEQHSVRRLPNGNLTIFDNGYAPTVPGMDRPYSRAVEYVIDEEKKTAALAWQYRHSPEIITYNGGSVERLPGGHTIIQWGPDNTAAPKLAMTEVDADGKLVCDVGLPQNGVTGSFTRMLWPLESRYITATQRELSEGNTYVFNEGTNVTGVTIAEVTSIDGALYNSVTVSRQPFAPVLPRFMGKAPRVIPVRVQMTPNLINAMTALVSFDVNSFGLKDPTNTTVYYRSTPDDGIFVPLPTEYNWLTHRLQVSMDGFGEFIFGFPDLPEVPFAPLLITPKQNAAINQNLPVSFFWTPKGFAASYQLQVSTDANFSTLVADVSYLTESRYTLPSVAANTPYFWRVNTSNDGGVSDWTTNSFTTVPPAVQVTVPNGGEAWQRGLSHVIQWNANVAENIALDLYKAGVFVRTIATNAPNIPAYTWPVGATLVPASDYSIRIRSTANAALFDMSDTTFSIIDAPVINTGSVIWFPDGRVQFGFTAPGAAQATVLVSTNLIAWQELQVVTMTNGSGTFTDETATNHPSRFYRLRVP